MAVRGQSRVLQLAQCCVLLTACLTRVAAQSSQDALVPYTTARAAHSETIEEAKRHHPVHLRAVVTFFDPHLDPRRPSLFVHDATGAVFVAPDAVKGPVTRGTIVDIRGMSEAGDFAPIVNHATVSAFGKSDAPIPAPLVSLGQLLSGRYEGQWISIEGVVRAVTNFGAHVRLEIATDDGIISAVTSREPGADYHALVDAKVRVHANSGPTYNRHLQLTGVHLFVPDLAAITVQEPAVAEPFSLPLQAIDHLLRYKPNLSFRHRERVRGAVTLQWPGRMLCVEDGMRAICMQTREKDPVALGDVVDAVGFPTEGESAPTMSEVVYRRTGERQVLSAANVAASEALSGEKDSALVQVEGRLIGRDKASDSTLMISSGKLLFPIVLPEATADGGEQKGRAQDLADGSVLRVTGICSVSRKGAEEFGESFSVPSSFRILLRSPMDIKVVEGPSWWNAQHLLWVLGLLLGGTLCLLAWAEVLRQRLAEQTSVTRRQNVELMRLSFQDGLTGLANRRRFDETLALEVGRAARSQAPLSLLMIDIDHFKALNDTCGHQRGDACLAQVAAALGSASIRAGDLIARYGGEEFGVILPMSDEGAAFAAAERMRQAVHDLALVHPAPGCGQYISVSVGAATIVPDRATEPTAMIALADQALYRSKQNGRNRTTCATTTVPELALETIAR